MAKALLPDDLWALIQPFLPAHHPPPKGGRPRIDGRTALKSLRSSRLLSAGTQWDECWVRGEKHRAPPLPPRECLSISYSQITSQ